MTATKTMKKIVELSEEDLQLILEALDELCPDPDQSEQRDELMKRLQGSSHLTVVK